MTEQLIRAAGHHRPRRQGGAGPGDGVARTMIYTHVLQRGGLAVRSPLD
jgi:hypothetical protein